MDRVPPSAGGVKYLSIAEEIAEHIRSGTLVPGSRTPSENEIIHRHNVSNTTARKALQSLENDGLVRRIKGRGTFVREEPVFRPATEILSFSENMRRTGLVPSTRVLAAFDKVEGMTIRIGDRNHSLKGPCYEIRRLRFGNDVPVMMETRFIDAELCPGLNRENLSGSLYELYEQAGLELTEICQSLSPVILGNDELECFGIPGPAPGMVLEGASYGGAGQLIEIERSVYRGDSYSFIVSARNQRILR
jgi:GntR family transcriptional regulator